MSILFAGGEDIDFPLGSVPVDLTAARFRSGYARCALGGTTAAYTAYSQSFTTPLTNIWATFRVYTVGVGTSGSYVSVIGITSSANAGKGIWIQTGNNTGGKVRLVSVDSGTTVLATETGVSMPIGSHRFDIRVQNYGSSGTVTVYVDLNPVITFTGNIASSGVTGLDQVAVSNALNTPGSFSVSEVIAADEDTRSLSLVTLIPNALGTTQQWTGTYTDINETTLSDATVNTVNTVGQNQQYALSDLPAGNFAIKAVAINARATAPAGSTANSVGLGVQTGGGTDTGSTLAPGTGLLTLSRIMATDPTAGGSQWTPTTINGMQLVLKSGA